MKLLRDLRKDVRRFHDGPLGSDDSFGMNGVFSFPLTPKTVAVCIISDGSDPEQPIPWEHVSVHVRYRNDKRKVTLRTPTWDEMCRAKDVFFEPEETVIQYHPAKEDYVNDHDHVLHLWRPTDQNIPKPPIEAV